MTGTRLDSLRTALKKRSVDGFLLPRSDRFLGEYTAPCDERLAWLTGFTGSAGTCVILPKQAALFSDSRYTLQMAEEVSQSDYSTHDTAKQTVIEWIKKNAEGLRVGYDPDLHSIKEVREWEKALAKTSVALIPLTENPIDAIWTDRPPSPAGSVSIHPQEYAGESAAHKSAHIAKSLKEAHADVLLLTACDSINWLLNIRGGDIPYNPLLQCYALITREGKVTLFTQNRPFSDDILTHFGKNVSLKSFAELDAALSALKDSKVWYDPANIPASPIRSLEKAGAHVLESADPCLKAKAIKNPVEQDGMRRAHERDGLALTRFLYWLDQERPEGLTELEAAQRLEAFRMADPLYRGPSFATISGSGPNGAIVHYRVNAASNRVLKMNALYLLDSGGQYPDGTTDVTRTMVLGTPTAEMIEHFTRVLKGHIALACAHFPKGTSGQALDVLARQYLWNAGLDYGHGTGHGVGSYLCVHEGPQRISKKGGDVPLEPGMVLSNEPGYYKEGEYGIRIENLVLVVPSLAQPDFLRFETLTLAPIDVRLIDWNQLNQNELTWLNDYHQRVIDAHENHLEKAERRWLETFLVSNG